MDGSHIIGGLGLLWALRSFKYFVAAPPNFFYNDHFKLSEFFKKNPDEGRKRTERRWNRG